MFKKEYNKNKIIFNDIDNNQAVTIEHYNDSQSSDIFEINKNLSKSFIKYVLKELISSNDINACYGLYDDKELENILNEYNFKIVNYEFKIKCNNLFENDSNIIVDSKFNDDEKKYALSKLNEEYMQYKKYYNNKYIPINEEYFNVDNCYRNIYRINGKIVGIVDYQIPEFENNVCIRYIVSDNNKLTEYIIKNILNQYKKDMIISCQYPNKELKNIIEKFNNEFQHTLYVLENKF